MREEKKSSVAGQANITAELPENCPYWKSKLGVLGIGNHPKTQHLCGLWGLFRDDYRVEAPLLPFIAERLLSTFLPLEPVWRAASYTHSKAALLDCSLTGFQREVVAHLKPLIDRSDAKGLFPTKLIKNQALFSRLVSLHNGTYFQSYPHPHNA